MLEVLFLLLTAAVFAACFGALFYFDLLDHPETKDSAESARPGSPKA